LIAGKLCGLRGERIGTRGFSLGRIAKKLHLNRSISQGILSQEAHDLVQAIARGAIFMKEITSKKNEVYLRELRRYSVRHVTTHIVFNCELQYLSEGVD
jgi:hypothetical protein